MVNDDGSTTYGNVYAYNPFTGIDGPVCENFWGVKDVSLIKNNKIKIIIIKPFASILHFSDFKA